MPRRSTNSAGCAIEAKALPKIRRKLSAGIALSPSGARSLGRPASPTCTPLAMALSNTTWKPSTGIALPPSRAILTRSIGSAICTAMALASCRTSSWLTSGSTSPPLKATVLRLQAAMTCKKNSTGQTSTKPKTYPGYAMRSQQSVPSIATTNARTTIRRILRMQS